MATLTVKTIDDAKRNMVLYNPDNQNIGITKKIGHLL